MKMHWQLLNTTALCRSPADEGGAGEGGEGGEAAAAGEGEAAATGEGEGEAGEAQAETKQRSSILDFASKDAKPKEGEAPNPDVWKLPEGLDIPEHLRGTTAEDTLAKLNTAYKNARQDISTRKKADGVLEGAVPKDIDGYKFEGDPEKDPVLKDLMSEESKPIVDEWRKAAMEVGIPDAAFASFMQKGMANMSKAGFGVFGDPAEQQRINGEAEMEALTQQLGKAGADQALRQLDTFAQKLANNGILTSQEEVDEFGQMVGTARAAQIMQRIISAEFGERAIPQADGIDGVPTLAEAYEKHQQALSMPRGSDRDDAVARAEAQIAKAMTGSSTNGAIRSKVL